MRVMREEEQKIIDEIDKYILGKKEEIVMLASYFMSKEFVKPSILYNMVETENDGYALEKAGIISTKYLIKDFLDMYTGVIYPEYMVENSLADRFQKYSDIAGNWFLFTVRNIYSQAVNSIFPSYDLKSSFCEQMGWDVNSPNPEYVTDLLELYEHTIANRLATKPFDVFPDYKDYSIDEFMSMSDKIRKKFDYCLLKW